MGNVYYDDDDNIGTDSIRLAGIFLQRVQDAGGQERLVPCLIARKFAVQSLPVYYALSYTWGPPVMGSEEYPRDDRASIRLNDQPFAVSSNLYDALLQLHESYPGVLFWIDAICINQENRAEREAQVAIMDQIYRRADKVIIWLGQSKPGIQKGVDLVRLYARVGLPLLLRLVESKTLAPGTDLEKPGSLDRFGLPPLTREDAAALVGFYQSRWFHRIWILQEVALAKEAWVHWSTTSVSWDEVGLAAVFLQISTIAGAITVDFVGNNFDIRTMDDISEGFLGAMRIHFVREFCHTSKGLLEGPLRDVEIAPGVTGTGGGDWLFKLILWTRVTFQASDKKDGLYGFLGILNHLIGSDRIPTRLMPDYASPTAEIMHRVAVEMMEASGSLQLLGLVCDPSLREVPEAPSWVPDLSPHKAAHPIMGPCHRDLVAGDSLFHASTILVDDRPEEGSFFIEAAKLHVRGQKVGAIYQKGEDLDEMFSGRFEGWANMMLSMSPVYEHTGQTRGDAFCRTIIMDQEITRNHRPASAETAQQLTQVLVFPIFASFERILEEGPFSGVEAFLHWYDVVFRAADEVEDCPLPTRETIREYCLQNVSPASTRREEELDAPRRDLRQWRASFLKIMSAYCILLVESLGYRRPFVAEGGYIGLGHTSIIEGDEVWILSGCPTPMILRKTSSENLYSVVGEAYVHGIMHGEYVRKGSPWEEICLV